MEDSHAQLDSRSEALRSGCNASLSLMLMMMNERLRVTASVLAISTTHSQRSKAMHVCCVLEWTCAVRGLSPLAS